jgi:nitrate/TMAO reductase-like tetraheme cytochrome c subunit
MAKKTCTKCGVEKELTEFYKSKSGPQGRSSECKACTNARQKANYDPAKNRAKNLRNRFGMSLEEYDQMLEKQNGQCKICGTDTPGNKGRFVVDHNHATGEVRGLLCWSCNVGIGHLQDDPSILLSAFNYLSTNGYYGKTSKGE